MEGSRLQSHGIAPSIREHSLFFTALENFWKTVNPLQKFAGAQPEDLRFSGDFLALFPGVSEKKVRREYLKLPPAYQQAMSFFMNWAGRRSIFTNCFSGQFAPTTIR